MYIIAGPNGAGKTTFAREFLPHYAECPTFVNADLIAERLSPRSPEDAAFRAGRMMLSEIDSLARRGLDFGFETTLSGKTHLSVVRRLKDQGYAVHIYFLWVAIMEATLSRIADRVKRGGHDVPEQVVRRRFDRTIRNFLADYRCLGDSWTLINNSGSVPVEIAKWKSGNLVIMEPTMYSELTKRFGRL